MREELNDELTQINDVEEIHFNYESNEKKAYDFSKYPQESLNGVAEHNYQEMAQLNQATHYNADDDALNMGDSEPAPNPEDF